MNFLENWLSANGSLKEGFVTGSKDDNNRYSKYFNQDASKDEESIGSVENPLVVMLPVEMDTELLETLQKMIGAIAMSKTKEDRTFIVKYVSEEDMYLS